MLSEAARREPDGSFVPEAIALGLAALAALRAELRTRLEAAADDDPPRGGDTELWAVMGA